MCKICSNEPLEGLQRLECYDCPNLTSIPHIDGLKYLDCTLCPNLTSIPAIKGLRSLNCSNCPNLTSIPCIEGLQRLSFWSCSNLTSISHIKGLQLLDCYYCTQLEYAPYVENGSYPTHLIRNGKSMVHPKMKQIYDNIFYLWKRFKFMCYVAHLNQFDYSDPRQPYMQHFLENGLYEKNDGSFKVGYLTSDGRLIWLKLEVKH